MNWVENKYINLLSSRLDKFKRIRNSYNFRCPVCGDSKKKQSKTRGWLFEDKQHRVRFYCHNCDASMFFSKFLKFMDTNLYYDYVKEKFVDNPDESISIEEKKESVPLFNKKIVGIKKISQLSQDHPAKKYVEKRLIPSNKHYRLYYVPKFKKWVNTLLPNKFENEDNDEPRLVIPFFDKNKRFFGLQGRSFNPKSMNKYITILLDDSMPKIYGLDTVDLSKPVLILEGPIDSLFLNNAVAVCGGHIHGDSIFDKETAIHVYDNERRSIDTIKRMSKSISQGYNVCFWPEDIKYKDINLMIQNGMKSENIERIIHENSFKGLTAQLMLATWKRLDNKYTAS